MVISSMSLWERQLGCYKPIALDSSGEFETSFSTTDRRASRFRIFVLRAASDSRLRRKPERTYLALVAGTYVSEIRRLCDEMLIRSTVSGV